jgi:hypothetical protein
MAFTSLSRVISLSKRQPEVPRKPLPGILPHLIVEVEGPPWSEPYLEDITLE